MCIRDSLVEGEFMQMEDVYRIDQGIERYMTKTQKKTAAVSYTHLDVYKSQT